MSHILNFRLISPKIAASLLDLPSVIFITSLLISVTVPFILSTKYNFFTGLFKMEFVLWTLNLAPQIWPSFPWSSSSMIPTLHTDLDFLSSSAITTSFNCICGRLKFCNFTLWFSLSLIRYSFLQRSQKWFRILFFWSEHLNQLGYTIFQMDQDWQIFSIYQTANDLASNIPRHHLRSSMPTACCSELPRLQTNQFASPPSLIYNLATPFSTVFSYCGPTSRKTHRATVPKVSSPSNLRLNYVQTFASHPKQNSFRHQKWRYLDSHV